ncbi:hypothetical protein EDC56_0603 [Sinobacterium caligoides]|uniref:Uncharacterized protein n=1 Tax=Sinobacterium caligoides TaxID=933926 RepID=A0A3N2DYY8_9GAMM|nr:hypothetical protein [Sinobacterium caligoides]ROS05081.1 hypothetical protein EDC56_0603 [Sinobacterium caligoides]
MYKKAGVLIFGAALTFSNFVLADGFSFNNADRLNVVVIDDNNMTLFHGNDPMSSVNFTPRTDFVTVIATTGDGKEAFNKRFRTSASSPPMCNYTLLVSQSEGHKHMMSEISSGNCTADVDNYQSNSGVPKL